MRAVVQRVTWARVTVADEIVAAIDHGLLVLLGVGREDSERDAVYVAHRVVGLRIFEDDDRNMNRSLLEVGGALLIVSQFTLYGDARKGRRPSFVHAMLPEEANRLCERFAAACAAEGAPVQTGRFGAMMQVELCNDGPVTILVDSSKQF